MKGLDNMKSRKPKITKQNQNKKNKKDGFFRATGDVKTLQVSRDKINLIQKEMENGK